MFKTTEKGTFKEEKLKAEHFEVVRTRNCAECDLDEEMRWLALHPSLKTSCRNIVPYQTWNNIVPKLFSFIKRFLKGGPKGRPGGPHGWSGGPNIYFLRAYAREIMAPPWKLV